MLTFLAALGIGALGGVALGIFAWLMQEPWKA